MGLPPDSPAPALATGAQPRSGDRPRAPRQRIGLNRYKAIRKPVQKNLHFRHRLSLLSSHPAHYQLKGKLRVFHPHCPRNKERPSARPHFLPYLNAQSPPYPSEVTDCGKKPSRGHEAASPRKITPQKNLLHKQADQMRKRARSSPPLFL